ILRGDEFDLVLLAVKLGSDGIRHRGVGLTQFVAEEAVGLDVGEGAAAHAGSLLKCGWLSLSTRCTWRPPVKGVDRKVSMQAFAISMPISRAPMAITFASLCSRASLAESGSDTSAARQAG